MNATPTFLGLVLFQNIHEVRNVTLTHFVVAVTVTLKVHGYTICNH